MRYLINIFKRKPFYSKTKGRVPKIKNKIEPPIKINSLH